MERGRQAGRPGGLYFSIVSHGTDNSIIFATMSINIMFLSFQPPIPSEKCMGWRGGLSYFCTDEPKAATNLPLRTSAKSLQESYAWLDTRKHKAKVKQTNAYITMHRNGKHTRKMKEIQNNDTWTLTILSTVLHWSRTTTLSVCCTKQKG